MKDIISIAMGELTTAVDNEVVKAVQKVGIDVKCLYGRNADDFCSYGEREGE